MPLLMASPAGPLGEQTSRLVEGVRRSVVVVHTHNGHGAGVVWDKSGLIVTSSHVVPRDGNFTVELADGLRLAAGIAARDRENDLALLQVTADDLPRNGLHVAPAGDSSALRVGEIIVAVGHPRGVRGTATFGIVSAASPRLGTGRGRREVLQADITLAPGNSGGPLVNTRGEVVGIACMILGTSIALAIPSRSVVALVEAYARMGSRRSA